MIPVTAAVWAPDGPCIWHSAERFVPDAHVRRAEPVPGGSACYRGDGALGRGVQPMPSRTVPPSVPSRNNDRAGRGNDDQRVVEHPRGRLPTLGLGAAGDSCLEGELAAAAAYPGQDGRCLQDV